MLGPLRAGDVQLGSRQQRRLLAALLVQAGTVVSADRLIDVLWGDRVPATATSTLHAYVSRLRSVLPGDVLITAAPGYLVRAGTDAARFEDLLAEARAATDPRDALERALALWRGPAYAEFADDEFARAEAVRLEGLRLAAVEDLVEARLGLGESGLAGEIEAHATAHPLRERPVGQLMRALYRDGRHAEALAVFRAFRDRLDEELGVTPSAELRDLETAILRQDTSLAPVRGLPAATSPLVGRLEEVAAVADALAAHRLVTLTGLGGVGKTRLALGSAEAVAARFPDGVAFGELAPVTAAADVLPALATATGAIQQPGRGLEDSLLAYLGSRELLLVVDNCEHLLDEAARLVDAVLRRCPRVTVLATSRTPLGVPGECLHPTKPLPTPDAVRLFLARASAVRPDFRPDDETLHQVTDMCRSLDGLPLAIELAAARIRSLNPADLAARMDDRFAVLTAPRSAPVARHRTLRSVLDWSFALLSPADQDLLARLSVFAGSWTPAAAERVCGGDLDGLSALVDSSLIGIGPAAGETRYTMLETLREYGGALLAERGEQDALRHAHAEYYTGLALRAHSELGGPGQGRWTRLLDAEYGNLRAAHRWAVGRADADLALRLSAGLYYYVLYQFRDEVVSWGETALSLPGAAGHPAYPAVCGTVGEGRTLRGDLAGARDLADRALAGLGDPDDERRLPLQKVLTAVALYEGRLDDCYDLAGVSLRLARAHQDRVRVSEAFLYRGLARTYAGDPAAGLAIAADNLVAARETGNPSLTAWAVYGQAEALALIDPAAARPRYEEAVALATSVRDQFAATIAEVSLAALLARTGETAAALAAFRRTVAAWHAMQVWHHQWTTLRNLGYLLAETGARADAATLLAAVATAGPPAFGTDAARMAETAAALGPDFAAATARGAAMTPDQAVAFALSLELVSS
ncbi:BTAD domain-containing putative transcriptional regulator [Paractinoplanes rishiriensis]|uniref:BTAD domain-containing putative transcriptional regulator n=1 Tax=Paractinoplanes rishiriensis TaxID=1050105 RepID=UPI0019444766|nr:BTAD domain-containing putative transcriptional regulator [Actinoplanes rishiriensis]